MAQPAAISRATITTPRTHGAHASMKVPGGRMMECHDREQGREEPDGDGQQSREVSDQDAARQREVEPVDLALPCPDDRQDHDRRGADRGSCRMHAGQNVAPSFGDRARFVRQHRTDDADESGEHPGPRHERAEKGRLQHGGHHVGRRHRQHGDERPESRLATFHAGTVAGASDRAEYAGEEDGERQQARHEVRRKPLLKRCIHLPEEEQRP